jgi:hypothetical protein
MTRRTGPKEGFDYFVCPEGDPTLTDSRATPTSLETRDS